MADNNNKENGDNKIYDPLQNNQQINQPLPNQLSAELLNALEILSRYKKHLTAAPTNNPRNFLEQIQFVDDGNKNVYANINGVWVKLGGMSAASSSGFGSASNDNNIVITCGFTPKLIFMLGIDNGNPYWSVGFGSGVSNRNCIFWDGSVARYYQERILGVGTAADRRLFDIYSLNSNGFTLSVSSNGTPPTVYYFWAAIG